MIEKPIVLSIEVTNKCNLCCEMCFKRGLKGIKERHMTYNEFKEILDQVKPEAIVLVGLGEPLLNPDFKKMLELCHKRKIMVNMATNGTLMNKEWSKTLIDLQVGKVSISLDSFDKCLYEEIRKGSKFEKVVTNISHFARLKREGNYEFPRIRIDVVCMKKNIQGLKNIIQFAGSIRADVGCLHIQPLTKELEKQHLHNVDLDILAKVYEECEKTASSCKVNVRLPRLMPVCVKCDSPWISVYIDVHGNVNICCLPGSEKIKCTEYYMDAPVEINPKTTMFGNIFQTPFEKIWNSKEYQEFRDYFDKIQNKDLEHIWTEEEYINLRKLKKNPKYYCEVCARRFYVVC